MRGPDREPPPGWGYQFHLEPDEFAFDKLKGDDSLWVFVYGERIQRPLYLRLGIAEGHLTCTGIFLGMTLSFEPRTFDEDDGFTGSPVAPGGGRPIHGKDLRAVKLPEILAALEPELDGWLAGMEAKGLASTLIERRRHGRDAGRLPRPGPRGPTQDELKAIAADYRDQIAVRTDVGRVVEDLARELNKERSTIYRWLEKARKLGYLDTPEQVEEESP